jgi:hypothetical protein
MMLPSMDCLDGLDVFAVPQPSHAWQFAFRDGAGCRLARKVLTLEKAIRRLRTAFFAREPRDGRIERRKRVLAGQLALIAAALFTGAAVYVSVAEQPARLGLDDRALLAEWKAAYHRGFAMQGPLALIGFSVGLIAARVEMDWRWVAGAFMLLANWPFTLIAILPTNKLLMEIPPQNAGPKSRALIRAWGRLHAVRSGLGATATVLFLWASIQAWLEASLR